MNTEKLPMLSARRAPNIRVPLATAKLFLAVVLPLFIAAPADAQINITGSTLVTSSTTMVANETLRYVVAEGATLDFTNFAKNKRLVAMTTGTFSITGPGTTIIHDVSELAAGNGPTIQVNGGAGRGTLILENVQFIRLSSTNGLATAVYLQGANDVATLKNVLFEGNSSLKNQTGAMRNGGTMDITSGTFKNNYALNNGVGAFGLANATAVTTMQDVLFEGNRSTSTSGAMNLTAQTTTTNLLTNVVFRNNWTTGNGGAIGYEHTAAAAAGLWTLAYTAAGGTNAYYHTGNFAGGITNNSLYNDDVISGVATFAISASSGGFLYFTNKGNVDFKVDQDVSLTIGDGIDVNKDTIASAGTAPQLSKSGSGALILNSDNSYYKGAFNINEGKVFLGNDNAKLGGSINIAAGALLGGVGTLTTNAGTVVVSTTRNSIIQIGLDGTSVPQTLVIDGNLNIAEGAILRFDLFNGGTSDRLLVNNTLNVTGTAIIDISTFITGTYNLGNLTQLMDNATVTIGGAIQPPGARQEAGINITTNPGFLTLIAGADISRILTWTGSESGAWNTTQDNWTSPIASSTIAIKFAGGDRVVFAGAASGTVTLAGTADIRVSDLIVNSAADYTFSGAPGIAADVSFAETDAGDPESLTGMQGKLTKSGAGTLVFDNSGANSFAGGIDIDGGAIVFSRADQIGTTGTTIRATGNATLRAAADIPALTNAIAIDAGKALTFDTQGNAVGYSGALSLTGTFVKTGTGALTLSGNNAAFAGATRVAQGRLVLNAAQLGGAVTLASGATLSGNGSIGVGAGGSFTAGAGSVIDIGDSSAAPGTLTFGALSLDNALLKFDLFGLVGSDYVSDQIVATSLTLANSSTLQIGAFQGGTYTLGVIDGLGSVANLNTGLVLRIAGGGRQSGTLSVTSGTLLTFTSMADISRTVVWNGSGSTWTGVGEWTGSSGVNEYASGDRVVFDGAAPASARAVTLADTVYVSDMIVSEDGYTFSGNGGVTSGTRYVVNTGAPEFGTASGKLTKTGTGALVFANTGGNMFEDGIDIGGGVIEFSRVDQIRTGATAPIRFTDSSTLRAAAGGVSGTIASNIFIAPGKTATLDAQGGTLALAGALSGDATAAFVQSGTADTLVLTGNSADYAGVTTVRGSLLLAGGTLGGTVNVESGARFGGHGAATGLNSVRVRGGANLQLGLNGDGTQVLNIANLILENGSIINGNGVLSGAGVIGAIASDVVTATAAASSDRIVFSGTLSGPGKMIFAGSGTKEIAGAGRLVAGAFDLTQGIVLLNGASGVTALESTGAINLASGAALHGAGRVKASAFANNSVIRVGQAAGQTAFGTMTIDGNYTASSGTLFLAVGMASGNTVGADKFAVTGAAGGVTKVTLIQTSSTLPSIGALPRYIITAASGQNNTVFEMQNGLDYVGSSRLVLYDVAAGEWYSGDPVPAVPSIAGLGVSAMFVGKAAIDSLGQRFAATRDSGISRGFQLWANGLYRHDKLSAPLYDGTTNTTNGVQAGADWTGVLDETKHFTVGLYYDSTSASMSDDSYRYDTDARVSAAGVYIGLRGSEDCWYLTGMVRGATLDYDVAVPRTIGFSAKGKSGAASVEIGTVLGRKDGWRFEPQLQATYQRFMMDDVVDYYGRVYAIEDAASLEYRAGLRIWREFALFGKRAFRPFAGVNYLHESKGGGSVSDGDEKFLNQLDGSSARIDAGAVLQLAKGFYANARASWLTGGKYDSYMINFGASYNW